MKKLITTTLSFLISLSTFAEGVFPIKNGRLDSNLDANTYSITNLTEIKIDGSNLIISSNQVPNFGTISNYFSTSTSGFVTNIIVGGTNYPPTSGVITLPSIAGPAGSNGTNTWSWYTPESEFTFTNGTITAYSGTGAEVRVPPTVGGVAVVNIGESAFSSNYLGTVSLKRITAPASVTNIGAAAFLQCAALTEVFLPSVTEIGSQAFQGCTSLTSVYVPSVTSLDYRAFSNCSNLPSIALPVIRNLEDDVFWDCTNLTAVYFSDNAPDSASEVFLNTPATLYYPQGRTNFVEMYGSDPYAPPLATRVDSGNIYSLSVHGVSPDVDGNVEIPALASIAATALYPISNALHGTVYAERFSFAQGVEAKAIDGSLAQGFRAYATNFSFAQGAYATANSNSFAQGRYVIATNYSFAVGKHLTATNNEFMWGDNTSGAISNNGPYTATFGASNLYLFGERVVKSTEVYTKSEIDGFLYVAPTVTLSGTQVYIKGQLVTNQVVYFVSNKLVDRYLDLDEGGSYSAVSWYLGEGVGSGAFTNIDTIHHRLKTPVYTFRATDGVQTSTATLAISFTNYKYVGGAATTNPTSAVVAALTPTTQSKGAVGNLTGLVDKYIIVAYPATYGTCSTFKLGGLTSSDWSLGVKSVTNVYGFGESFNVYSSPDAITGSMSYEVSQ